MKIIFLFIFLTGTAFFSSASSADSSVTQPPSVLVIPYKPAMHLSDADPDLSEGSQMDMREMRETLRKGVIKSLNKNFAEVYDVRVASNDFVKGNNRDMDVLYHTLFFESDSVYTLKYPKLYAINDTIKKKKEIVVSKPETKYINVGIYDQMLIPDLSEKYDADYFIFLNEIDIETHFEDCLNLALKIYRRDLKVHYSIFDKNGKQLYGDVAVSHFASNSNDVNEIISKNFPAISEYILASLNKVAK